MNNTTYLTAIQPVLCSSWRYIEEPRVTDPDASAATVALGITIGVISRVRVRVRV